MFSDKLNELLEEEISKVTNEQTEEITRLQKRIKSLLDENDSLYSDKKSLEKRVEKLNSTDNAMRIVQPLVSEDNFIDFLDSLAIEETGIKVSGMYSEDIPVWFKVIVKYYNHKDTIFKLMDFADIPYPDWASSFKMPYDYNEEELDIFFDRFHNFGMTNGCHFEHNMGFFWNDIKRHKANTKSLLNGKQYVQVPWNLLLRNERLVNEKFFVKIQERLSKKHLYNDLYFLKLQKYQRLSDSHILSLIQTLKNNENFSRKNLLLFVEKNVELFKNNSDLARGFESEMSISRWDKFHYVNYPIQMQLEFIRNSNKIDSNDVFEIVKKLECSKKEKISLINDLIKKALE